MGVKVDGLFIQNVWRGFVTNTVVVAGARAVGISSPVAKAIAGASEGVRGDILTSASSDALGVHGAGAAVGVKSQVDLENFPLSVEGDGGATSNV